MIPAWVPFGVTFALMNCAIELRIVAKLAAVMLPDSSRTKTTSSGRSEAGGSCATRLSLTVVVPLQVATSVAFKLGVTLAVSARAL